VSWDLCLLFILVSCRKKQDQIKSLYISRCMLTNSLHT